MDAELLRTIISTSSVSALLIFMLTRAMDLRRRRKQARADLTGIQLEVSYSSECADEYVSRVADGRPVWTPNYRTITNFIAQHLSWLAAEGYTRGTEAQQIFRFLTRAAEINRSLEMLQSMTASESYKIPT